MGRKFTIDEVRSLVRENSECELLSTEYNSIKDILTFRCKCGNEFSTILESFLRAGKRQCKDCGEKLRLEKVCVNEEYIKDWTIKNTNNKFIGAKDGFKSIKELNLEFLCEECKENTFITNWASFRTKKGKRKCEKCSGYTDLNIDKIKKWTLDNTDCILLSSKYTNNSDRNLEFLCGCKKNTFTTNWSSFSNKKNPQNKCKECSGVRTIYSEKEIREYILINSNCNIIDIVDGYKDAHTRNIILTCEECGEDFFTNWTTFKSKNKRVCNKCSNEIKAKDKRMTHEEYVKRIESIHGLEYTVLSKYINSKTQVLIRHNCKDCGNHEWWTNSTVLLKEHGCPICASNKSAMNRRYTHDEYIERVKELHGDKYTVLNEYITVSDKILVRHNSDNCNHYEWEVIPSQLLRDKDTTCPMCANRMKKTTKEFINDLNKFTQNEYEVLSEYINAKTDVTIKHIPCGNVFNAKPTNLLNTVQDGKIYCPYCNISNGEYIIQKYLSQYDIYNEIHKEFDGLTGLGGRNLSYDVYLPNYNLLIEYQGEQHYKHIEGWITKEEFQKQQIHDNLKRQFAKDNGYELLEIPYTEFHNIETILTNKLQLNNENIKTTA